jgi:peptidylprolyl isomerase
MCAIYYTNNKNEHVYDKIKVPDFGIQGGDITQNNGLGGESIYGGYFEDETFSIPHIKYYMLHMANKGRKNTNGSQFFINTVKTSWLANKSVIFGMVLEGFEYVDHIEYYGTVSGRPLVDVIIEESGELPLLLSTLGASSAETFMEET